MSLFTSTYFQIEYISLYEANELRHGTCSYKVLTRLCLKKNIFFENISAIKRFSFSFHCLHACGSKVSNQLTYVHERGKILCIFVYYTATFDVGIHANFRCIKSDCLILKLIVLLFYVLGLIVFILFIHLYAYINIHIMYSTYLSSRLTYGKYF